MCDGQERYSHVFNGLVDVTFNVDGHRTRAFVEQGVLWSRNKKI